MGGTQVPVAVGRSGSAVIIRADGSCTVAICETVGRFVRECHRPDTTDLYFDLSDAGWLDSTFIGFLLSLVGRTDGAELPAVHLFQPKACVLEVLENMHVLHMFHIAAELPPAPPAWEVLPPVTLATDTGAELVIGAHQQLIDVDPRNAPVFQPVVDLFEAHRKLVEERRAQTGHVPPSP